MGLFSSRAAPPIDTNTYQPDMWNYVAYDPNSGKTIGPTMSKEEFVVQNPNSQYGSENLDYDYLIYKNVMEDAAKRQAEYQLKQSDPKVFAAQKSNELVNNIFNAWAGNNSVLAGGNKVGGWSQELESIKEIDPQSYYNAKLKLLSSQAGWDAGQGKTNADTNAQIQDLSEKAIKAGVSQDQLNSLIQTSFSGTAKYNADRIASADNSGFLTGVGFVAPLALGAYGLDTALTAASAASAAAEAAPTAGQTFGSLVAPSSYVSPSAALTADVTGSTLGSSIGTSLGGTVGSITAPTSAGALGLLPSAEAAIAAGAGADLLSSASSFSPAGVGGLNAALPAAGSVGGAGSMSAALPAGTMIGDGTLGTVMGASYAASAPGQFATDILGNAIPASSIGIGSTGAAGGYELLSNLGNALKGAQVAKGLLGAGKNPAVNQPTGAQPMQQQQRQYAGVDYSPILNLLAVKSPERTRTSLLG